MERLNSMDRKETSNAEFLTPSHPFAMLRKPEHVQSTPIQSKFVEEKINLLGKYPHFAK
jgi:hypothetical protein